MADTSVAENWDDNTLGEAARRGGHAVAAESGAREAAPDKTPSLNSPSGEQTGNDNRDGDTTGEGEEGSGSGSGNDQSESNQHRAKPAQRTRRTKLNPPVTERSAATMEVEPPQQVQQHQQQPSKPSGGKQGKQQQPQQQHNKQCKQQQQAQGSKKYPANPRGQGATRASPPATPTTGPPVAAMQEMAAEMEEEEDDEEYTGEPSAAAAAVRRVVGGVIALLAAGCRLASGSLKGLYSATKWCLLGLYSATKWCLLGLYSATKWCLLGGFLAPPVIGVAVYLLLVYLLGTFVLTPPDTPRDVTAALFYTFKCDVIAVLPVAMSFLVIHMSSHGRHHQFLYESLLDCLLLTFNTLAQAANGDPDCLFWLRPAVIAATAFRFLYWLSLFKLSARWKKALRAPSVFNITVLTACSVACALGETSGLLLPGCSTASQHTTDPSHTSAPEVGSDQPPEEHVTCLHPAPMERLMEEVFSGVDQQG